MPWSRRRPRTLAAVSLTWGLIGALLPRSAAWVAVGIGLFGLFRACRPRTHGIGQGDSGRTRRDGSRNSGIGRPPTIDTAGFILGGCSALLGIGFAMSGAVPVPSAQRGYEPAAQAQRWETASPGRQVGGQTGVAMAVESVRGRARAALERGAPGESGRLLVGMALGDDSGLAPTTREEFRRASLTHVTAASGQNIALLLALVLPLLSLAGVRRRRAFLACAALAIAYVPLAGGESPIRRACAMALCALLVGVRGGRGSVGHSLVVAAALTLAIDPGSFRSLGWQLSFVAVAGMVTLGPRLSARLVAASVPAALAEPLAATVAATLATTPLIAHAVGRASLVAVPANLVAAPAVAAAMLIALAASFVAQVSVGAAAAVAAVASIPSAAVLETAALFSAPERAAIPWRPSLQVTVAVTATPIVLELLSRRAAGQAGWADSAPLGRPAARSSRRSPLAVGAVGLLVAAAGVLVVNWSEARPADGPRVHFLPVGQGDAELIADGDEGILIDTGPPGTPIAGMVEAAGVRRLTAVVLTHGQSDHVGALGDLLSRFRPQVVVDGTAVAKGGATPGVARLLRGHRLKVSLPREGDSWAAGRSAFTVIGPERSSSASTGDPNANSLVGVASAAGLEVLLTADCESASLPRSVLRPFDVLKLAHHGSSDPGLEPLLGILRPRLVVIEVGRNPYGHPAAESVAAVSSRAKLLRTDRDGEVIVTSGQGGSIEWKSG